MTQINEFSIDEIRHEIRKFNNDQNVIKLERHYLSKSLPEILGASRKELPHSSFIAWLLNDQESHQLNTYPLRKLLELLVLFSSEKLLASNKDLFDSIILSDFQISNTIIETERSIRDVGRLDIYYECEIKYNDQTFNLKLIIENKVGAKEHSDQTVKYYNYYESIKQENDIVLYIFLTPISSLELIELIEPECSCKEYIQINYQSIVDFILEPALNRNITTKTKFIISEYLQSLSQPTISKDDDEYKQGLIMALGTDERNLLTKFWDKNQKLILASLYAISSDPEQEKDTRESASEALSNLSKGGKDRSLCSISYNGNKEVDKIRKSDIGYSTIKILEKYNRIKSDTFEFLRTDRTANHNLLKTIAEITDTEVKYGRYRVKNDPELIFKDRNYYVVRNWGINNVNVFIEKMESEFKELKYEIN